MNSLLALVNQPTPVLVALFNSVAFKKLTNGQVNPLCVNICKILNKRGYDIDKLDFEDGKHYSADRSSDCDETSCLNGKGSKSNGSGNTFMLPTSKKSRRDV